MSSNVISMHPQAQTQLSSDQRYSIGPELDHYIDTIIKNSTVVSHSSKPSFKKAISQLCDEVTDEMKFGSNSPYVI